MMKEILLQCLLSGIFGDQQAMNYKRYQSSIVNKNTNLKTRWIGKLHNIVVCINFSFWLYEKMLLFLMC